MLSLKGKAQNFIPLNTAAYSPNTLNKGFPKQATQDAGRGFYTAPGRTVRGQLVRDLSPTFRDVWSQPRLFYNSLLPAEQQILINAIRFETSHIKSNIVKQNVLIQLNRVSHDIATRVAEVLGMTAPDPDPTHYHNNKTINLSVFEGSLKKLDWLVVGMLASTKSMPDIRALKQALSEKGVQLMVVAEELKDGVDMTYSAADATAFDAIMVGDGANKLFSPMAQSTLFPTGRPLQIVLDGYRYGKPVAAVGNAAGIFTKADIPAGPGVYKGSMGSLASDLLDGLKQYKFLNRYPTDQ